MWSLPVYSRIAAIIKAAGLYAFIHSDGDMRKVIDLIAEAGYDCIHPVDAQAGVSLSELQKEFGEKISFMGHIDMLGWDETRINNEIELAAREFHQWRSHTGIDRGHFNGNSGEQTCLCSIPMEIRRELKT